MSPRLCVSDTCTLTTDVQLYVYTTYPIISHLLLRKIIFRLYQCMLYKLPTVWSSKVDVGRK